MSKRDLIVTAILLNIGILVGLLFFASSGPKNTVALAQASLVGSDTPNSALSDREAPVAAQAVEPSKKQSAPAAFDEIDQLLEEYMASDAKADLPASEQQGMPKKTVPVLVPLKSPAVAKPIPVEKRVAKDTTKETSKEQFYTVRQGDNPWTIARKFHISFEKLLELNSLNETKARNLKIGQRLKIRE